MKSPASIQAKPIFSIGMFELGHEVTERFFESKLISYGGSAIQSWTVQLKKQPIQIQFRIELNWREFVRPVNWIEISIQFKERNENAEQML
jgi:hypothetical protein